jgi:deoxyadenosine/deoxycytidine kinase
MMSLFTRHKQQVARGAPVNIYERSIRAAKDVFLESSRTLLAPEDFTFLFELGEYGEKELERNVLSLYLHCSPAEMLDRVRARARPSEEHIS